MDLNRLVMSVSDFASGINSQENHIKLYITRKGHGKAMIYEQLPLPIFQRLTCGPSDFLVKTCQSQENAQDCKMDSDRDYFTKLLGCSVKSQKKINLTGFSPKMLKEFLAREEALTSCDVSLNWGNFGYDLEYQLLNSKDFGVPQNRERVYIVGRLGADGRRKVFPIASTDGENFGKLQEITKGVADSYRIYDSDGLARTLKSEGGGLGAKTGLYAIDLTVNNPKTTKVARCLQARYNKGYSTRSAETTGVLIKEATKTGFAKAEIGDSINIGLPNSKTRRGRVGKKIANTLTTPQEQATLDGARIRRLTPLECWRLQGFTDEYFHKAQAAGVSDTQLYKQAGNAVTVNVARAIGLTLKELENENLHL